MRDGTFKSSKLPYGYKKDKTGEIVIDEVEAEFVRLVFKEYLDGYSMRKLIKKLYDDGVLYKGKHQKIPDTTINRMLKNQMYIGNTVYGKVYREDKMPYKLIVNKGERPSYIVENNREPIIDIATFMKVQEVISQKKLKLNILNRKTHDNTWFRSKIRCPKCGYNYYAKYDIYEVGDRKFKWSCKTRKVEERCYTPTIYVVDLVEMYLKLRNTLKKDNYVILNGFIEDLKSFVPNENSMNINGINEKIILNKKQNHRLSVMHTDKLIDSAFFIEQKNILEQKNKQLEKDKKLIEKRNELTKFVVQTTKIINTLEQNKDYDNFNKTEFDSVIEKIVPITHLSVQFYLKNGLVLEERINCK